MYNFEDINEKLTCFEGRTKNIKSLSNEELENKVKEFISQLPNEMAEEQKTTVVNQYRNSLIKINENKTIVSVVQQYKQYLKNKLSKWIVNVRDNDNNFISQYVFHYKKDFDNFIQEYS